MAVESPADLAGFFDPTEFGETVQYRPAAGNPIDDLVILIDDPDTIVDLTDVSVVGKRRTGLVPKADLPGGRKGDLFVRASGEVLELNGRPRADESGAVLRLPLIVKSSPS